MPSEKRAGDDLLASPTQVKFSRTDLNGGSAKKKSSAGSSRTGQACDRCKIRKIRCDARPGGCSPCIQNNTECKTTDRITGRATSRGHTENVENENATLRMYVMELQQQLKENGVDPITPPEAPPAPVSSTTQPYWSQGAQGLWDEQQNSLASMESGEHFDGRSGGCSLLSDFRADCIGDNYLGVASANSWLSPIEGTSLTLFGAKIDLSEYLPPDLDPEGADMSYQIFLDHALGQRTVEAPPLPPPEQGKMFAEWFFRSVQPFIPVLHKPDFMHLLNRVYHEDYQPNVAETVMLHMVMAILNFQYAVRNHDSEARATSFRHYHYALTFVHKLMRNHTLEDIQALTLICAQLRSFPRPGAAWIFTKAILDAAVEMGLHRSIKAWQNKAGERDAHTIEMRKRVFWTLLTIQVTISGTLGRPMPLRLDDFDVEIPEFVDDNLPEEADLPAWRKCSWRAGIYGFEFLRIHMQIYSTIYSIRCTSAVYETSVRTLDKELKAVLQSIPPEMDGGPMTKEEDRVSALYLQLIMYSCQLLIHHPALCRSPSTKFMNENIDVCLETSKKMLKAAASLHTLKSLDSTFYTNMSFLAAIFTTLFAHTERRDTVTSTDLQLLRQEMDSWLEIMGEIGELLGTSKILRNSIGGIVDWSLNSINHHLIAKTATAAVASADSPAESQRDSSHPVARSNDHRGVYESPDNFINGYANASASNEVNAGAQQAYAAEPPQQAQGNDVGAGYQDGSHFSYTNQHNNNISAYPSGAIPTYDQATYTEDDIKPNINVQLAAQVALAQQSSQSRPPSMTPQVPAAGNYLAPFQSPASQHISYDAQSAQHSMSPAVGPIAWRNFADNMMTNVPVGEQHFLANPDGIMPLGARNTQMSMPAIAALANMGNASFGGMQMPPETGPSDWPLLQYRNGT